MDPDAARLAAAELGPQSLSSLQQPLTAAAWHDTPTTYVIGTRDAGVPPTLSTKFSQRADKTAVLDAAHSGFYSRPVELARILREELRSS